MLTINKKHSIVGVNGIALHKNNLFNGLPVAQSLTGFLRGFFMEEIKINKGFVVLIDKENLNKIMNMKWYVVKKGSIYYAAHTYYYKGKSKRLYMHRYLMDETNPKIHVDHINGNGLDNRKLNLRSVTAIENGRNRGKQSNNKSGYKGVYWNKQKNKWHSVLRHMGKKIHLGFYDDAKSASESYYKKAKEIWSSSDLTRIKQ